MVFEALSLLAPTKVSQISVLKLHNYFKYMLRISKCVKNEKSWHSVFLLALETFL